jgi:sorbose reductase
MRGLTDKTKGGNFTHNNTEVPKGTKIMPLFSLEGKTAIISGAGAGIGLAAARGFAEAGANVVIWYYSNKNALTRAEEIEKEFGVKCTLTPHSQPCFIPPPPDLSTCH